MDEPTFPLGAAPVVLDDGTESELPPPPQPTMCMACGSGLREDDLCPMCESKIAAGL